MGESAREKEGERQDQIPLALVGINPILVALTHGHLLWELRGKQSTCTNYK